MKKNKYKVIRVDCDNETIYILFIENSLESFKKQLGTVDVDIRYLPTGDVIYTDTKHLSFVTDMNKSEIFGHCIIANNCEEDVVISLEHIKSLVPENYVIKDFI